MNRVARGMIINRIAAAIQKWRAAGKISIVKRPRIGVDYAKHWARRHLQFYIKGNPFVSRK
jgi:DNA-3-methyladenine glycosylase